MCGNRNIERPENSLVDCMNALLDALRALQRDGAGRPRERGTPALFILLTVKLPIIKGK